MKRQLTAMMLALLMCISFMATPSVAIASTGDGADSEMDVLDVMISAYIYMESDDEEMDLWPDVAYVADLVPLYNTDEKVVAWYLRLISGEFAVVNNNKDNPTLIEYGNTDNALIREILDSNPDPHIVYNSPFEVYDTSAAVAGVMRTAVDYHDAASLYDNYPDLTEENRELKSMAASCRKSVELQLEKQVSAASSETDYGFISDGSMPGSSYNGTSLSYGSTDWAIMDDYSPGSKKNHCGATCITNLALLLARGNSSYSDLKKSSAAATLESVYGYVGNGPIIAVSTLMSKAKDYFTSCGYTLNYASADDFSAVVTAIGKGRPCCLLLEDTPTDWHWVLAVGWRQYSVGGNYFQIVTGWKRTDKYFYKINSGSTWIAGASCWAS